MQIFVNPNYDFIKWRWHAIIFSIIFITIGAVLALTRGINYGIDFAGGAGVTLRFTEAVPLDMLRQELPNATIQQYGKPADNSVLIRLPQQGQEGDYAGRVIEQLYAKINPDAGQRVDLNFKGRDAIAGILVAADPDRRGATPDTAAYYNQIAQNVIDKRSELGIFTNLSQVAQAEGVSAAAAQAITSNAFLGKINVLNQETVGPQVGQELQRKALLALVLSTLAMGIYITIRFDLKFGVAAMVCLIHDVLFAFAFLVMINGELSLIIVAAFLMIIGYSVNDTVVIYDRVRENLQKSRNRDFATVLNESLNQTLSRTILTTGTVLLVLLSLIFFGGDVIREFALVLFVGCLAGTLSTLTIVTAMTVAWMKKSDTNALESGRPAVARKGAR